MYNSNIESGGESMDVTEIGFKIKSYRERNNIKQSEMAEKLGLTISALSKIESGKQKVDASTLITFIRFSKEYEMFFEMDSSTDCNFTNTNQIITGNNRTLFERLTNFCKEYPFMVNEKFSGHEIGRYIRHQLPIEILEDAEFNTDVYKAYGSVGIGTWAKIPWIAFLDKSITNTVQKGIYITYLFKGDGSGFYLSLNQGYSFYKERYGDKAKSAIKKVAEYLKNELRTIDDQMDAGTITLDTSTNLGLAYEDAHIMGKYYDASAELQGDDFIKDFKSLMLTYKEVSGLLKGKPYEAFIESIVNYQSPEYANEIADNAFFKKIYFSSTEKMHKPDIITEVDGKKIMFEMKTYNARPRRNAMMARQSMEIANYRCEYNPEHETFLTNNGKPYVEAHHLIPIKEQERFKYYLDNSANIVVLCPLCHKAIHNGSDELREKMLRKLFYSRIEKLESKGIELTFSQLKKMYGIEDNPREETE